MEKDADAVARLLGDRPRWFRPVKRNITGALLNSAVELGHDIALWSVGRRFSALAQDDDIVGVQDYTTPAAQPGSVMLLHDGIGRSQWEWSGPDQRTDHATPHRAGGTPGDPRRPSRPRLFAHHAQLPRRSRAPTRSGRRDRLPPVERRASAAHHTRNPPGR